MSKTALNKKNLETLGAQRLAELLIEVTKGRAVLQRRLRLELSVQQGAEEAARDVLKRFAAIRQARGFISRRTLRGFAKELTGIIELIETRIAPEAPQQAFDLLWDFLHLFPGILRRTDDRLGLFAPVLDRATAAIGAVAPQLAPAPEALADALFDVLAPDPAGPFRGTLPALAGVLGPAGLARLRARAEGAGTAAGLAILRAVADLQGDVDGWLAAHDAEALRQPGLAPQAAARLLAAGRAEAALALVEAARAPLTARRPAREEPALEEAFAACLTALGRRGELRDFLWQEFLRSLSPASLRQHLKLLPDFDDIEAEDRARQLVQAHPDTAAALNFFVGWPDLAAAAALVEARSEDLGGLEEALLTAAAEALQASFPLAAVLLRRQLIARALARPGAAREAAAAGHLTLCAEADGEIFDYLGHPDHLDFLAALRRDHGRRRGFWAKLDG